MPNMLTVVTLACASSMWVSTPAHALNILLTNDDGFEAASLHAVYRRLEAKGHSVIISAPAFDATAAGGGFVIGRAIEALPAASRGTAIPAGAPGIGTLPSDEDVHYVNGTPTTSLLYGLDIVAKQKWGKRPDLVISGVNYGLNVGRAWSASGTIGAATAAISRTVPAIAVSAEFPGTTYLPVQQLKPEDREYDIADFVVRLVDALEQGRTSSDAPLLPPLIGLNVNLPAFPPKTSASLAAKPTHSGTAAGSIPVFVSNLARDWTPVSFTLPGAPGIAYLPVTSLPADVARHVDADPSSEYNVVKEGLAAVSPLQGVDVSPWSPAAVVTRLVQVLNEKRSAP
jgi:5'-nucleotidase